MIKNVFFDFNGTLLDDAKLCFDIETKLLNNYNLPQITFEKYLEIFCFPVKRYYELVGFDFSKIDYNELSHEFMDEYFERFGKDTKVFDEVIPFLKELKNRGIRMFVVSATKHDELIKELKEKGIDMFFEDVVGSSNILGKGKIEYAKEFISDKNIQSEESIFIGDTIHDFEVGTALNMKTYLVDFGHNSRKILEKVSKNVVSSFKEILKDF